VKFRVTHAVFQFEDFEFRPAAFVLLKSGIALPLEPKALHALEVLILNRGRVVKKDELLDALWPDTIVSENSLTRCIAALRRQLGDNAREPRFIATVHTQGYRFLYPLEASPGGGSSLSKSGGPAFPAPQPKHRSIAKWLPLSCATLVVAAVSASLIVRFKSSVAASRTSALRSQF